MGKCTYASGSVYEGNWRNGKRHGEGKYTDPDGSSWYEGGWKDDKEHGKGKVMVACGSGSHGVMEGVWKDGEMHGRWKMTVNDETFRAVYDGNTDDETNGEWKYTFADGKEKVYHVDGTKQLDVSNFYASPLHSHWFLTNNRGDKVAILARLHQLNENGGRIERNRGDGVIINIQEEPNIVEMHDGNHDAVAWVLYRRIHGMSTSWDDFKSSCNIQPKAELETDGTIRVTSFGTPTSQGEWHVPTASSPGSIIVTDWQLLLMGRPSISITPPTSTGMTSLSPLELLQKGS